MDPSNPYDPYDSKPPRTPEEDARLRQKAKDIALGAAAGGAIVGLLALLFRRK